MSQKDDSSAEAYCQGVVKWFNNKAGYGFVTATSGDKEGSDIFAHHTSVQVSKEQYKYLVQGEYVEFQVVPTEPGVQHDCQAGNIRGVNSGKLMCETRFENRRPGRRPRRQDADKETEEAAEVVTEDAAAGQTRRGGGPRQGMRGGRRGRPRKQQESQEQTET